MKLKLNITLITVVSVISIISIACRSNVPEIKEKTITDDLNRTITIKKSPQRVITLAPNLTEFFYALNIGNKIIGNTTYCNYPPAAKLKEKVGNLISIDFEKILSLKPDVIFMTVEGNSKSNFNKLINLGMTVFVSNPRNYKGIKKTLIDIGDIFHKKKEALSLATRWDSTINLISNSSHKFRRLKSMFVVSLNPLMLAGKNTFINSFLEICNLENIAKTPASNYPIFSRERILQEDPEIILLAFGEQKKIKGKLLKAFPEWSGLSAFRQNKIFVLPADLFLRPGPRFVTAVKYLFELIRKKR